VSDHTRNCGGGATLGDTLRESLPVKKALSMIGVKGGEVKGGLGHGWEGRETPGGGETPLTPRDFLDRADS